MKYSTIKKSNSPLQFAPIFGPSFSLRTRAFPAALQKWAEWRADEKRGEVGAVEKAGKRTGHTGQLRKPLEILHFTRSSYVLIVLCVPAFRAHGFLLPLARPPHSPRSSFRTRSTLFRRLRRQAEIFVCTHLLISISTPGRTHESPTFILM